MIDEIASIVNRHSLATVGTRRALVVDDGDLRLARYVPPNAAWTIDGRESAAWHWSGPPYVVHEIGVFGGARALLGWAEGRACEQLLLAPAGARVVAQSQVLEADRPTRHLLEEAGYAVVRTWVHLETDLDSPVAAPVWPDGITVGQFDQERDWPAVGAAMDEAFIDHWGHTDAAESEDGDGDDDEEAGEDEEDDLYSNSRSFCFVAMAGSDVAGVLLGNARTVEWPGTGKIGSVSVRRPYRRRGVATALLLHALGQFSRHGVRRVVTDTDRDSFTAGPPLYERVGFREFRRELVVERELRPGRELRTLQA